MDRASDKVKDKIGNDGEKSEGSEIINPDRQGSTVLKLRTGNI